MFQGMDEVKRLSVEHQVWELEWETAFNIQLRIQDSLGYVIAWAGSDVSVPSVDGVSVFLNAVSDTNERLC